MIDSLITEFDKALRTVFAPAHSARQQPGQDQAEAELSASERRHAAALMRVNHCGEICAQALYQGQSLTSHDLETKRSLEYAAAEETEHLYWTAHRISELGGHKSILNPLWYAGSLSLGLFAGWFGDRWNLGFLAETERQVEQHLENHLGSLPAQDKRSRAIIEQMKADEAGHAKIAVELGAKELPQSVKLGMRAISRVMTYTAYYL